MKPLDVLDVLNAIEQAAPVDEWMVGPVPIWPVARAEINWVANEDNWGRQPRDADGITPSGATSRAREVANNAMKWRSTRQDDGLHEAKPRQQPVDVLVVSDGVSKVLEDGHWYDRLCEPVIEAAERLGHACLLLDPGWIPTPRHRSSVLIQPAIDRARAASVLGAGRWNVPAILPGLSEAHALLNEAGLSSEILSEPNLRRQALLIERLTRWWSRLIASTGARAVFFVDSNTTTFALNRASRAAGIPSVELQHGVQGPTHWAYARWNRLPIDGVSLLPTRYWVWSEHEAATIRDWAGDRPVHQPLIGGNMWLRRWFDAEDRRGRWDAAIDHHAGLRVLVTLQPGFVNDTHLAPVTAAMASQGEDVHWTLRAHPIMSAGEIEETQALAARLGAVWEPPASRNLYSSLDAADVHVTHSSSTVLEAAAMGVRSLVLHPDGAAMFRVPHELGMAVTVSDPDGFVAALRQLSAIAADRLLKPPPPVADGVREVLGEPLKPTAPGFLGRARRTCRRCVMDESDPNLVLTPDGCNNCEQYLERMARLPDEATGRAELARIVDSIQEAGKDLPYDCLLGLSGGVDSSYVALQASKLGLRPLAIHFDNGWDSEPAVRNIQKIVEGLGYDLVVKVVNWEEFKDIQLAYLRAGVLDIEMITDHGINALVHRTIEEFEIPALLSGNNLRTEGIMPVSWGHRKSDLVNLQAIARAHGTYAPTDLPTMSTLHLQWWQRTRPYSIINVLDYMPYDKFTAITELERELDWKYYGGKHYESIFTRFYQAEILPRKFGVDKRRAHLSALIASGLMSRADALVELDKPLYEPHLRELDTAYVCKKWGLTEAEFNAYMTGPVRSHYAYASDEPYIRKLLNIKKVGRQTLKRLRG